jgi:hypothetical protein
LSCLILSKHTLRDKLVQKHLRPDYQGTYDCEIKSWQIGLGHQRLSIYSSFRYYDERKQLTLLKISELLFVLEHPELPLHNNPAELAARTMVQRRNISYATQTLEGTQAWDTFMFLVATTRKLGISFFEYIRDCISQLGNIPSLATIIRE